jgi:hypothetical protein
VSAKTKSRNRNILKKSVGLVVLLLVVVLVVGCLELTNTTHFFHTTKQDSPSDHINYAPATAQEQADSESHKNGPAPTDTANTPDNTSGATGSTSHKKTVTVEITTYRQQSTTFDVNSQVNGVVESGGTCTLSMIATSNPSEKITQSRLSEANASNTTCGVISVPLSKLHAGTWNVSVAFSSSDAQGKSDINQLKVQ